MRKTLVAFLLTMLTVGFILASALPALALKVEDHPADSYRYTDTVEVSFDRRTGLLKAITYNITNTGATWGIRYRTKEITFEVGDFAGSIDALSLRSVRPQPGQRTVSVITITVDDIAEAVGATNDENFRQLVSQPGALKIGAVIEIYSAATGKVLDTITDPSQIEAIAGKYGFDRGSIEDMHSRFKGGIIERNYEAPKEEGSGSLIFRAVSQDRKITRELNTAKWTDWVTAELRPPAPTPPRGHLDWWEITSAELTYPLKNPEFTFGTPYPPVGTKTVQMKPNGHVATVEFQEDWAMDGAKIYSIIEDKIMAEYPKSYTITAKYTIKYQYSWTECDEDGCWTETRIATTTGTVSGSLLVNGTGVNSLAE